jgi:hypothetical protein
MSKRESGLTFEELRRALILERKFVRLNFDRPGSCYFKPEFVNQCVDELKRLDVLSAIGEQPSPLQKLAAILLFESAGVEVRSSRKR